ncbi:Tetratricopeptide repeat protein 39C [Apophysomyces sp. BC1034]|nr:Tetratricopeptide repeat protein 39C [Apophysomyces sp. BC1015]KAG0179117.1 Tetratricopeptide repeat protein 39C [Apophysomyces sp. BC1021]KAG0193900.1 Tetratricopeptide repeat protein 39C [Apophysomyces sp. BC1034]
MIEVSTNDSLATPSALDERKPVWKRIQLKKNDKQTPGTTETTPADEHAAEEEDTDEFKDAEEEEHKPSELSMVISALRGTIDTDPSLSGKDESEKDVEEGAKNSIPEEKEDDTEEGTGGIKEEEKEESLQAEEQEEDENNQVVPESETPTTQAPEEEKQQQQQEETHVNENNEELLKESKETEEKVAPAEGDTEVTGRPAPIDTSLTLQAVSEPGTPVPQEQKEGLNVTIPTEAVRKSIEVPADKNMAEFVTPPTPGAPPSRDSSDLHPDEDEHEYSNTNMFSTGNIDFDNVKPNMLKPRAQEKYDEEMLNGMNAFFNNKFSKAKAIFETRSNDDPLYALGLGSMAFIKAITSSDPKDVDIALATLTETYQFANAQIEAASAKKPLKDTVSHYFTNMIGNNPTNLPTNTRPLKQEELRELPSFIPNGALRAHVIKAECGLLMGIIHLTQETVVGYLKTGLNLRRAYNSYSLVWQEYKRMGQEFNKHMDQDTISAIQFGIGAVHLVLSSLPPKILRIVSAFGWKADKHLGFALLKLCLEGKRIRSPLASLTLLSYYVILTSYAPQILTRELIQPAIECLLDAQKNYPNSAFFLYFAGRVSRLAKNLSLSTQSFVYTYEVSQGEWAEVTMGYLATFEIAFNSAMGLDWASAAVRILELQNKHKSPAFLKYFYGACMEMLGNRTEAILAFAEAPQLMDKKKKSQLEQFVLHRVEFFEQSGYQDMDFSLPALEILFMWNTFPNMATQALESCLEQVDSTLERIYDREKQEYEIRMFELAPSTPPPDYYDQRGSLLLIKSSILNALGKSREAIVHLNWIIDHKDHIKQSKWIVPFAYWESGVTCWAIDDFKRARALWETALSYSGYDLEYRLAIRLNLAVTHAIELGVPQTEKPKPAKGRSTNGRKRMSIIVSKFSGSAQS